MKTIKNVLKRILLITSLINLSLNAMEENKSYNLNNLPDEIIVSQILSRLERQNLLTMANTNRRINHLVDQHDIPYLTLEEASRYGLLQHVVNILTHQTISAHTSVESLINAVNNKHVEVVYILLNHPQTRSAILTLSHTIEIVRTGYGNITNKSLIAITPSQRVLNSLKLAIKCTHYPLAESILTNQDSIQLLTIEDLILLSTTINDKIRNLIETAIIIKQNII